MLVNASAAWTRALVGRNQATGTVTTLDLAAGSLVESGQRLYSVDLRPVVVAEGEVPAFRDVAEGMAGPDVAQLQVLLQKLGFDPGDADGKATTRTTQAVKSWQKASGVAVDGVVRRGDVIYVPKLPIRLALAADLATGVQLGGGEPVLDALPDAPEFTLPVTPEQARMAPTDTLVIITAGEKKWEAVVSGRRADPTGAVIVELSGRNGAICGADCGDVPVADSVLLPSQVITVPTVAGSLLPTSALLSSAGGGVVVVTDAGDRMPVEVLGSARGMSVVSGVEPGVRVRVPAAASDQGGAPGA